MKQITIYDLLPLIKPGFVAMDADDKWWWYETEPYIRNEWRWGNSNFRLDEVELNQIFNIKPFEGDWRDSLMKCGE